VIDPKPSARLVSRACGKNVPVRLRITVGTSEKLHRAAKCLHLHHNATGRLLDLFADLLVEASAKFTGPVPGLTYGRLTEDQVRAIRRSDDKILSLAVEHGVSERTIVRVRSRVVYRWVR